MMLVSVFRLNGGCLSCSQTLPEVLLHCVCRSPEPAGYGVGCDDGWSPDGVLRQQQKHQANAELGEELITRRPSAGGLVPNRVFRESAELPQRHDAQLDAPPQPDWRSVCEPVVFQLTPELK